MNELLEQLPEIMESDAFSLTNATREEDETGNKDERDDVPPHATTEVDTTKVVKTPEVAEEVEIENREGQEKEDKESKDYEKTNDMQEEENLPNEEENIPYLSVPEFLHNNFPPPNGTGIDSLGNIYALRLEDEVDMTEVMAIESSGKGGSEKASAEDELPLEEAPDIAQTEVKMTEDNTKVEISAITGKNDEGKDAEEGTADQAGPPDGGVTL